VSLSNKNKKSNPTNSNGSNSGNNGSNNSTSPVHQDDPNDPSTFTKDPNLKRSFYGMAYTPNGALYPSCNATIQDVITDVQIMSQLTKVSLQNHTPLFLGGCRDGRLFLGCLGAQNLMPPTLHVRI